MLQDIKNKKWETKASINLFCKRLNQMLLNNDVELPNMLEIKNFGNFDNSQYRSDNKGVKTTLLDRYYVNEVVFSSSIKNHPLDDLYGALGNFVFRITPKGTITFVSKNTYKVSYQKIAIYFMDSFDFQDEIFNWESPKTYISQLLGFWDFANNEVSKIPFPSSTYIDNSVYQDYQNETYKGGDFILISDFEEIEVDFSFYIKRDFLGNFIKI